MKAIIFDMDDTLAATAALWKNAERRLLESIGGKWSAELAGRYKGMNALDVAATIHAALRPPVGVDECQRRMRGFLLEGFRSAPPEPMPGAVACVQRMGEHVPLAVASGSPMEAIENVMERMGVRGVLAAVVSSESVPRGKPHPDVFLLAAEKLSVNPRDCLVFEDSVIGVKAAVAAGMGCFAVPSGGAEARAAIVRLQARVFEILDEVTWQDVLDQARP